MNICNVLFRNVFVNLQFSQNRAISFYWITKIFNAVDHDRIKEIGPNLACAEWLLKNGAEVRFKGDSDLTSDYNKLIALEGLSQASLLRIQEVYAKEVSLTNNGFEYFKNCDDILKMSFISCILDDKALLKLAYVKNSLQHLEVRSCKNVGDAGILSLAQLSKLKTLTLADLNSLKRKDECENTLKKALPGCNIDFQ